jgi:hypothetical protein
MARKKKLYLVWQASGNMITGDFYDKLCGVFDDEEKALELKSKLDLNEVLPENCWTIVPKAIWENWPTIETTDSDGDFDFDYVSEYEGYTLEQRDLQEDRWFLMTKEYSNAVIQEVYMNDEL